jgi:hypothetical protein
MSLVGDKSLEAIEFPPHGLERFRLRFLLGTGSLVGYAQQAAGKARDESHYQPDESSTIHESSLRFLHIVQVL